jgi:hypothetical protein
MHGAEAFVLRWTLEGPGQIAIGAHFLSLANVLMAHSDNWLVSVRHFHSPEKFPTSPPRPDRDEMRNSRHDTTSGCPGYSSSSERVLVERSAAQLSWSQNLKNWGVTEETLRGQSQGQGRGNQQHWKFSKGIAGGVPYTPELEPQPEKGVPEMLNDLSAEEKAEWIRITQELNSMGILSKVNRSAVLWYVTFFAKAVQAKRKNTELGEQMIFT